MYPHLKQGEWVFQEKLGPRGGWWSTGPAKKKKITNNMYGKYKQKQKRLQTFSVHLNILIFNIKIIIFEVSKPILLLLTEHSYCKS